MGEIDKKTGYMLVGVPDGMGAYLLDDTTIRFVYQSESYGPLNWWSDIRGSYDSYPFIVNPNGASFTGSHIMYIDYDREQMSNFMEHSGSAEPMVKAAGNLVTAADNLKGDLIGKRNDLGNFCSSAPHFSNTDPDGCTPGGWNQMIDDSAPEPEQADWVMMSLCSAHLEEKHQWGPGLGVEDDLFITNEEWTEFVDDTHYTGIPAHVLDLKNYALYAAGVFTLGGFEKIVEVNCGHKDYVWPKDVVPSRIYIGKKGMNAKGQMSQDFLSRNGLAYGQLYGFATNIAATTNGLYVDDYSKVAAPGSTVAGAFYPIDWMWDGEVKPFTEDGSWAFQHKVSDGYYFWNSNGPDAAGSKTEHNSPDPYGGARYIQSSTAGHFGIYDFTGVTALLNSAGGGFPTKVPATYTLLQGEQDITGQIQLGGKGMKANGADQKTMSDKYSVAADGTITDSAKKTFEDIDGFEWVASSDSSDGYVVIQEDGSNDFGERTFISKVRTDGTPMTFYFLAMSGGDDNTRNKAHVGVPAGVNNGDWSRSSAHEFSGVTDFTGMLTKNSDGSFVCSAGDGACVINQAKTKPINDKTIAFGLQAHSYVGGVIQAFRGDAGGQVYAMKPKLP